MQTATMPAKANTKTWRAFPGTAYQVILSTRDTGNRLLMAEMTMLSGAEPPRHIHEREDEIFILQEGSMQVFRGNDVIIAHAGDTVWLPRNMAHHYRLLTPFIKAIFIATPGNIQEFFDAMSQEVNAGVVPPTEMPTPEAMEFINKLMNEYGMKYL